MTFDILFVLIFVRTIFRAKILKYTKISTRYYGKMEKKKKKKTGSRMFNHKKRKRVP